MIDSQTLCTTIKSEPINSPNGDDEPNNSNDEDDRQPKQEDANNNCETDEQKMEEAAELTAKLAANARAAAAAAFVPGHVTLEALENTRVAVAQFAANALANPQNEAALKELAMLQSTLFTLQHQQVLQLQLIQQLQSHLTINQGSQFGTSETPSEHESEIEDEDDTYERDEKENMERRKRALDRSNVPLCPDLPRSYDFSDIITNHGPLPPMDALNSLQMLQKRTQEVLDSASQGILSGNLADDLILDTDSESGLKDPSLKHRCRFCGKIFGSDSALQIHLRSHTGERPFKCNVCGSRFTTKGNLKVHYQRHSFKFPHVPMNQHPIPEHLDKYHPPLLSQLSPSQLSPNSNSIPVPSSIAFPGLQFYSPSLDMIRAPQHSIFGSIRSMNDVDEMENRPADLRKLSNARTPPPASRSPSPPRSTSKSKIKCELKDETERVRRSISPSQRESDRFPTPSNYDENSLESSKLNVRPRAYSENISSNSLPLPHCSPMSSASSTTGSMFNHHLPIHPVLLPDSVKDPVLYTSLLPRPGSNDNSWESLIEITKSSETTKLQRLVDNLENKITDPNECIVCHRVLSCKSALQMHYRTHTGERPFRCRICGRAFTTKGNLKTHMGVHRMKPPMRALPQCPVCHKKFTNAIVLQQHIRLHTGEPTDLTPEQISASEVRDFPTLSSGHFPMGINTFPMSMHGMHTMRIGSESSQGDNDDYLDYDDDYDDTNSFMDDTDSANGLISERPNSGSRMSNISALENQVKTITSMASQLSAGNFKRSSEYFKRDGGDKSPSDLSSDKRSRPSSPAPSDMSTGALDLTPKSQQGASSSQPPLIGIVPDFSILHGPSVPIPKNNQPILPPAPFNPLGIQPVRGGNSTCNICYKTFACHSALEIHYRSHTKERPFKCTICDRGFSTKGNMKQHMLTHKIRDIPHHMFNNTNSNSNSSDFPLNHNNTIDADNRMDIKIEKVDSEVSDNEDNDSINSTPKYIMKQQLIQHTKYEECVVENIEPVRIKVEPEICQMSDDDYSEEDDEPLSKRAAIKLTNSDVSAPQQTATTPPASNNNTHDSIVTKHNDATNKIRSDCDDDSKILGKQTTATSTNKTESQSPRTSSSSPINTKHYCFICRKNFSSTSALHIHNRTHTGDKPFKCHVCQKAFTTKGNLKVHMGTHMWTNGASRRGRRMSLELPLKHPLHLSPQDAAFLQQRPELFYPYVQPHFMNGIHQKITEMNPFQPNYSNNIQNIQLNKCTGYLGLSNFARLNEINHSRQQSRSPLCDHSASPPVTRGPAEDIKPKSVDLNTIKSPAPSEILKT